MSRKFFSILIIAFIPIFNFAQPKLKIEPDKIEFKSDFDRLKNILFINEGTDTLSIDSIYYKNYDFYFLRFNKASNFPIHIAPGDTIKMDCILTSYYYVPSKDTLDNMVIYSNGTSSITNVKIDIGYFEDKGGWGTIKGNIRSNSRSLDGAEVFILHNGSRIVRSITANSAGNFSAVVPTGFYTIAARKDSFYTTYYGQTFSPYNSKIIKLAKDDTANIDINLPQTAATSYSICGQIIDSLSLSGLRKGIIVVRRGGHTPSKISSMQSDSIPQNSYSAIINSDGTYQIDNITEPGYYIIQAFSDYYVPSYYKSNSFSSPFWEKADSIYIGGNVCDLNIYMPRDSSVGGGIISGTVAINQGAGNNFSDIILFAQSVDNSNIFNHTIVDDDGKYIINELPYGKYRLIAQKIGYNSVYSYEITIDSLHPVVNNVDISFDVASIKKENSFPTTPVLYQNYPNPFNPSTNIRFFLPEGFNIELKVVNILGEEIKTIYNGYLSPGEYKFSFHAEGYSSGVYFIILNAENFHLVRKILLLK